MRERGKEENVVSGDVTEVTAIRDPIPLRGFPDVSSEGRRHMHLATSRLPVDCCSSFLEEGPRAERLRPLRWDIISR